MPNSLDWKNWAEHNMRLSWSGSDLDFSHHERQHDYGLLRSGQEAQWEECCRQESEYESRRCEEEDRQRENEERRREEERRRYEAEQRRRGCF